MSEERQAAWPDSDPEGLPYPSYELASRVGSLDSFDSPSAFYELIGKNSREDLLSALPAGYTIADRRILDFGSGAGRTVRHFLKHDAKQADFAACDIDEPSVAWLREHLSPSLDAFVNGESPPLPVSDQTFDLVYCVSVFTHLARSWSEWLLEMHRILKPDGILQATFMGRGQADAVLQDTWNEDSIGMLIMNPGQSWDDGGPMVMHSPWWIREHWGRLFEIVDLREEAFITRKPGTGHGLATMRKRDVDLTADELEAPGSDPREYIALRKNCDRLIFELEELRGGG